MTYIIYVKMWITQVFILLLFLWCCKSERMQFHWKLQLCDIQPFRIIKAVQCPTISLSIYLYSYLSLCIRILFYSFRFDHAISTWMRCIKLFFYMVDIMIQFCASNIKWKATKIVREFNGVVFCSYVLNQKRWKSRDILYIQRRYKDQKIYM